MTPHSDIDGDIPQIYDSEELEKWRPFLEEVLENNPSIMHYMVGYGMTACMKGGDKTFAEVRGHHHFKDKSLVGCQFCLEWLHA